MSDEDRVGPQDPALRNSPRTQAEEDRAKAALAAHEACYYNDKKYSDGSTLCADGTRLKCWNGKWVEIGLC